jgi:hypothetical protein
MIHRHLNQPGFSLAAIDDMIARGKREDWAALRKAAVADKCIMEKVMQVCRAHISDPYAQRYHFWNQYAQRQLS